MLKDVQQGTLYFSLFQKGMGNIRFKQIHAFQYRNMQQFFGQMPLLKTEMDRWVKQKNTVLVIVSDEDRAKKSIKPLKTLKSKVKL